MKTIHYPCTKHTILTILLLIAMFTLGLWLGGCLLPRSSLNSLYSQSGAALAATLPATKTVESALPISAVLASAGLPQPKQTVTVHTATETTGADNENSLIIISPKTSKDPTVTVTAPTEDSKPQAIIYCTHSSEEYSGQTRIAGKAGGIMAAAEKLAQELQNRGINVIHDQTLHDTNYNTSYASSLETIGALAEKYPEVEMFIDVHRDSAIPGVSTRLEVNDLYYARMMIIVGSDEKLEHPNWQKNYDFALRLTDAANALMPGIMREPRVYSWRYNQHLGTQALIVEIGSTDNTEDEAERSAAILAEALLQCK